MRRNLALKSHKRSAWIVCLAFSFLTLPQSRADASAHKTKVDSSSARITAITVTDGASEYHMRQNWPATGCQNWGCVKDAGTMVTVEVTISKNTADNWNKIVWNGGSPVSGQTNNWRQFSRADTAEILVQPKLAGSFLPGLRIWVMWATLTVNHDDASNYPHAVAFGNVLHSPTTLGKFLYFSGNAVAMKVIISATISPARAANVAGWSSHVPIAGTSNDSETGWNWNQSMSGRYFGNEIIQSAPNHADDSPARLNTMTVPTVSAGTIYMNDGPNLPPDDAADSLEKYFNYIDSVSWNGQAASDPSSIWTMEARWCAASTPQIIHCREFSNTPLDLPTYTGVGCVE